MPKRLTIQLTQPEANHLLGLLFRNKDDGVYSGPRDQHWARHKRLVNLLWNCKPLAVKEPKP
jgi:hypothetical protein